jgi:uncharacterized protein with GYD domain
MPHYISLVRYTQKGMENIKQSPPRLEFLKNAWKAAGGKLVAFYLTMGRYDAVLISEFPNDETAAQAALATGAQGNVRTESLRAFTEEEFKKLVAGLP